MRDDHDRGHGERHRGQHPGGGQAAAGRIDDRGDQDQHRELHRLDDPVQPQHTGRPPYQGQALRGSRYVGLEDEAKTVSDFGLGLVPGLLQTADYARAMIRGGPRELDRDEIERRVEVRMSRQQILFRDDRPRLWAVIDEAVIRRIEGSPAIMTAQLRHLAEAAEQGKTTLQVVPFSAGAHAGTSGPFVILELPEPTEPGLVYVETLAGDIYLEERADVDRYTLAFDRLRAASLHPDDSVQLIEQVASSLT